MGRECMDRKYLPSACGKGHKDYIFDAKEKKDTQYF